MESVEPAHDSATRWEITTPSEHGRLSGVSMAGFRDRAETSLDLQVIPYPAVTVVVDTGEGLLVEDIHGRQQRGSVALGFAPGGVRGRGLGVECLQIRLSPTVAHATLGAPLDSDGAVTLEDLWGRDGVRIQERLRAATSWADRFAIAEAGLARRYEAGTSVDPEIAFVWQRVMTSRGQIRVEHLATEVGWSRKRLWSRFRSQVGLTPKRAAQLVRFDHAVHRLAAGHSTALVATESGYADQSHMNREVMTFAGVTPRAASAAPWLAVDDVAWATSERTAQS